LKLEFRAAEPSDLPQITTLLQKAFRAPSNSPFLDPSMMKWKYWDSREDWTGPRNYLLERGGAAVGHAGLWPVAFTARSGQLVRGIQMIDWAASRDAPGAGLALLQRLTGIFDFIYSIGGSEMARKVLPAFGFRDYARTWKAARPLRPLSQIFSHPQRNWKLGPRLVRNCLWALYPPVRSSGWQSIDLSPRAIPRDVTAILSGGGPFFPRPPAFFEYLLRCPGAKFQLHLVRDPDGPRGLFVLARVSRQVRVAGVWLCDPNLKALKQAYVLSQQAAANMPEACEIVTQGTERQSREAAASSGFRLRPGPTVYFLDRESKLAERFEFQSCDDDVAFCDDVSYWT
jgi:hypothetical protein